MNDMIYNSGFLFFSKLVILWEMNKKDLKINKNQKTQNKN